MSQPMSPIVDMNNVAPSNTNERQYAERISSRKDKAISSVETAHAERATINAIGTKAVESDMFSSQIARFETYISDLVATEGTEWTPRKNDGVLPQRISYNGTNVVEANAITMKLYTEKQGLVEMASHYISLVNDRNETAFQEQQLLEQRSNDFEEQLEIAIAEQDEMDKTLVEKEAEIIKLRQQVNKSYKVGPPFLFFAIVYSYMFGAFGAINIVYNHLWIVGMVFYILGATVQIFFETGATTTHMIINTTHSFCTLVFPNPVH
jgi:hypothetical protein